MYDFPKNRLIFGFEIPKYSIKEYGSKFEARFCQKTGKRLDDVQTSPGYPLYLEDKCSPESFPEKKHLIIEWYDFPERCSPKWVTDGELDILSKTKKPKERDIKDFLRGLPSAIAYPKSPVTKERKLYLGDIVYAYCSLDREIMGVELLECGADSFIKYLKEFQPKIDLIKKRMTDFGIFKGNEFPMIYSCIVKD